jgi:hypothetical protein
MKSSLPDGMTYEEKRRLFFERLESDYYFQPAKPKVPVVSVPVTWPVAEAVKANPSGVRLSIPRTDGVTLFVRAQANPLGLSVTVEVVEEVDGQGLPVRRA